MVKRSDYQTHTAKKIVKWYWPWALKMFDLVLITLIINCSWPCTFYPCTQVHVLFHLKHKHLFDFWLYGSLNLFILSHPTICSNNLAVTRIEWLQDGQTVHSGNGSTLSLTIDQVQLRHAGMYSCRALLTDGTMLGPDNAGRLTVFGKHWSDSL